MKKLLLFLFYLNVLSVSLPAKALSQDLQSTSQDLQSTSQDLQSTSQDLQKAEPADSADLSKNSDESKITSSSSVQQNLLLNARVTDTYVWSEQHKRYSLKSSQFNFKVLLEEPKAKVKVVDSGNILNKPKKDIRYLYVSSAKVAQFLSAVTGTTTTLEASLSKNKENLTIYLPAKDKADIVSALVSALGMDFSIYQNKSQSSDYSCHIENKNLVCVIDYVLRKKIIQSATKSLKSSCLDLSNCDSMQERSPTNAPKQETL